MKSVIVLTCLLGVALCTVLDVNYQRTQFLQFQQKYGKVYKNAEEFNHRFAIFQENMKRAEELQAQNPKATFGVTKFSDLSPEEFEAQYLMNVDFKNDYVAPPPKDFALTYPENAKACKPDPKNYDWTSCGCDTPIYNQGQCGSCWAFSATETIESYFCLAGNKLTGLSMEQIVDCDTAGEDEGCNGGFPTGAYEYVEEAGGLETYQDYPYTAEGGESGTCNFQQSDVVATVTGYNSISGETGLYQQMSSSSGGPVSVCVDASTWSSYTGGILTSCGDDVDHCVQAVGYHNYGENGAYWIVRNSWGTDWGINGFIWIEIGQDLCSIGDYATIVTATKA